MWAHEIEMQTLNRYDRRLPWQSEQYLAFLDGSSGELGKTIRLPKMRGEDHGKR